MGGSLFESLQDIMNSITYTNVANYLVVDDVDKRLVELFKEAEALVVWHFERKSANFVASSWRRTDDK